MKKVILLLPLLTLSRAEEPFYVTFDVTLSKGVTDSFELEVHPDWAPLGAARFKEMVEAEFFKGVRFFVRADLHEAGIQRLF